jgi:hypothetical protein
MTCNMKQYVTRVNEKVIFERTGDRISMLCEDYLLTNSMELSTSSKAKSRPAHGDSPPLMKPEASLLCSYIHCSLSLTRAMQSTHHSLLLCLIKHHAMKRYGGMDV